jgi:hypothetical protein
MSSSSFLDPATQLSSYRLKGIEREYGHTEVQIPGRPHVTVHGERDRTNDRGVDVVPRE